MNELYSLHIDPVYWLIYAANCAPYAGALYLGFKLCVFFNGWIDAKLTEWRYQSRMTRADQNGLYPISSDALINIADPARLIALANTLIESRKTHPNVPQSWTYAPHNSQDRALDVSLIPGMNATTGGGAFTLLDAQSDGRFVSLPEPVTMPAQHEKEVTQDASE